MIFMMRGKERTEEKVEEGRRWEGRGDKTRREYRRPEKMRRGER